MRLLVRVAIGLALLVVLALGLVWIFQGSVVKAAVQHGGTWATGVETRVDDVSAGLLGGRLELEGLTIANPPGFSAEPFFALRSTKADWDTRSLFGDEIHVRELELDGLALRIERNSSGANYKKILEHARSKGGQEKPEPSPDPGAKKTLVVDRIVLTDLTAELKLADLPVATGPLRVTVPRIELKGFRSDGETHELVGRLLGIVVDASMSAALEAGQGVFPADLVQDLERQLDAAKSTLEGVLQGDPKSIQDAGKQLEGLKDIFGKPKK